MGTVTDGYGDISFLDLDFNTIEERWVEDVGALDGVLPIYWVEEAKEERFDTNLLEERFARGVLVLMSIGSGGTSRPCPGITPSLCCRSFRTSPIRWIATMVTTS